jgi:hypothetical protein
MYVSVLVYADYVNILGRKCHPCRKTQSFIWLLLRKWKKELNIDETEYTVMPQDKYSGQSHILMIATVSLKGRKCEKFRKKFREY